MDHLDHIWPQGRVVMPSKVSAITGIDVMIITLLTTLLNLATEVIRLANGHPEVLRLLLRLVE